MAGITNPSSLLHPKSGFCSQTKTFHSLGPKVSLPPPSQPLSIIHFITYLLHSTTNNISTTPFLINAATGDFLHQTNSLALFFHRQYSLSKGDVAFILSPPSLHIPLLYFALLSLGVIVSPANPGDSISEITHQIQLSTPTIIFATSKTSPTMLLDSPEFLSFLTQGDSIGCNLTSNSDVVSHSDVAVFMYSSGTTGRSKGVVLTHRNLIAAISQGSTMLIYNDPTQTHPTRRVSLTTRAFFHISGLVISIMRAFEMGETWFY